MVRWILHVDMDAFYASVEQRDHPEYRDKPLIVGGVGRRGVVATASYEARKFGVHSAMPMELARRRCPQGIFIAGDHDKYSAVSTQIMAILADYSPLIEPLSLDEAFLDLSGMELIFASPLDIAREIKRRVREDLQLVVSAGLAPNKFLAKMASDLRKPDGLVVVDYGCEREFLADLPIEKLWGVGEVTAKSLRAKGFTKIAQLAALDEVDLRPFFGQSAATVYNLVRGIDNRPVVSGRESKSIGAEETFPFDLTDADEMRTILTVMANRVGARLRHEKLAAWTITLKLRYGNFQTLTRQRKLTRPTQADETIYRTSVDLLTQHLNQANGIRLLGVSASHFESAERRETSLFDDQEEKGRQISTVMDQLREKFGSAALLPARMAATNMAATKRERKE